MGGKGSGRTKAPACLKCGANEWGTNSQGNRYCKPCRARLDRERRARNREKHAAYQREWRKKNIEHRRAYMRDYMRRHRGSRLAVDPESLEVGEHAGRGGDPGGADR